MGEDVPDGVIKIIVAVVLPRVHVFHEPFAGITERLEKPMLGLKVLAPDLGIIRAGEDHFDFVHSLEGE